MTPPGGSPRRRAGESRGARVAGNANDRQHQATARPTYIRCEVFGRAARQSNPVRVPDGDEIRRERERNGWSQRELAADVGISETELVLIEHGLRPGLAFGKFFSIAEALGVACESLLTTLPGWTDHAEDDWTEGNQTN